MKYTPTAAAALRNADRLTHDAEILLAAGSFPTAHALAVLGLEEVGKHVLIVAESARDALGRGDPRAFHRKFRSHEEKLTNATTLARALQTTDDASAEQWLAEVGHSVTTVSARKLSGFYVDLDNDRIVEPLDSVSADDARHMVAVARRVVDMAKRAPSAFLDLDDRSANYVEQVRQQLGATANRSADEIIAEVSGILRSIERPKA